MEAHRRALEKGLQQEVESIIIRNGEGQRLFPMPAERNLLSQAVSAQLLEDGLIESAEDFDFSIDASRLKVNGKKQSDELHRKYRALLERTLHREQISGKDQIDIQVKDKDVRTRVQLSGN
jgi:hypothetical protein